MIHLTTDTLTDFIHGELALEDDASAHTHLQACDACRVEYQLEVRLSEALRQSAGDDLELPGIVKARIWQAVSVQPQPLYSRILSMLRPAIAIPVAAALAIVLYFGSPLAHRSPNAPMVDASYYFEQHAAEAIGNPLGERSVTSSLVETSDAGSPAPTLGTATAAAAALDAVE